MGAQWKAKHRTAAADTKGRVFGKLSKEISIAARGGADPDTNPRLRLLVEQARKLSMPRETLERALKRHQAKDGAASQLELLTYEGFAPHRVPVIVECLTDNVNRTGPEVRVLFRKGQLGNSGSVSWDFDYVGLIEAVPARADVDAEAAAIEAGAQDVETGDGTEWLFVTESIDLDAVCKALPASGCTVQSARLGYRPKHPVSLGDVERQEVETFLAALDDHDDVQNIYVGLR